MNFFKKTLILVLGLSLAACYPLSSKYPLGNQVKDKALIGIWEAEDEDIRFVFERKDGKTLSLTVVSTDEDEDGSQLNYLVTPSRIGGKTYMSVMQVFPKAAIQSFAKSEDISFREAKKRLGKRDKRANGYYLGYYEIKSTRGGPRLFISMMDTDSDIVEAALADGTLKGGPIEVMTEEGEKDDILFIKSSKKKLTAFVKAHGDDPEALFDLSVAEDLVKQE